MSKAKNKLEEAFKQSTEAGWSNLGTAIADALARGSDITNLVDEACVMRRLEQDRADRQTQFAALVRQIGDAKRTGREIKPYLERLCQLRREELGPWPTTQAK